MRPKERIPIILKHIDWDLYLKYIGADCTSEHITNNIKSITKYWEENYDQRLVQVLINLEIIPNLTIIKYWLEEFEYIIDIQKVKPEKILLWGTYGKDGKQPLKYIPIEEMETSHIEAVLKTQNLNGEYFNTMKKVLRYRKLNYLSTIFRKGDLLEYKKQKIEILSDAYLDEGNIFFDTNIGKMSYINLWKKAKFYENIK